MALQINEFGTATSTFKLAFNILNVSLRVKGFFTGKLTWRSIMTNGFSTNREKFNNNTTAAVVYV